MKAIHIQDNLNTRNGDAVGVVPNKQQMAQTFGFGHPVILHWNLALLFSTAWTVLSGWMISGG